MGTALVVGGAPEDEHGGARGSGEEASEHDDEGKGVLADAQG